MGENSEVKKNRIWDRIRNSLSVETEGGISAFCIRIIAIIDAYVDMMGDQIDRDAADIRSGLAKLKENIRKSLSATEEGGISEVAYKVQYAVDYWFDLVFDKAAEDKVNIGNGLRVIGAHIRDWIAVDEPGGLSEGAARFMGVLDRGMNTLMDNIIFRAQMLRSGAKSLAKTTWEYRRQVVSYFVGLILIYICIIAACNYTTGYEYSYNGRTLGIVKNQEDVTKVLDIASRGLTDEYGVDVQIDPEEDFEFTKVFTSGMTADTSDDVLRKLTYMQDTKVKAYGIYVDDKKAAVVESEEAAKSVLQKCKDKYVDPEEAAKYKNIEFKEDISIKNISTTVGKLMSANTAVKLLTSGESKLRYTVALGDTPASIAKAYGMSEEKFREINSGVSDEQGSLRQGAVVNVINKTPKITVEAERYKSYSKVIPFDTKTVKTDSLYEGDKEVRTKGKSGKKRIKALVKYEDGKEVGRRIVKTTVEKEPVTKVVAVGTKKRPATIGSGHLINPCPAGYQSSSFGARWGGFHRGVDLACGTGNNIYAADGGTVIVAGYNGSYGNYVKIDHQNGMVTLYGHASALCVSPGQKVYQGQVIAKVGNTGHSFGSHCHFEVQVNGALQNPRNYI